MSKVSEVAEAAVDALDFFNERCTDCSCMDDDDGTCWYHLDTAGKRQRRVDSVVYAIEDLFGGLFGG